MPDRFLSSFRPATNPTVPQPFSVRSVGHFQRRPGPADRLPVRPLVQLYWVASGALTLTWPGGTTATAGPGQVLAYGRQDPHHTDAGEAGADYRFVTLDGPLAESSLAAFGLTPPWPRTPGPPPVDLFDRLRAQVAEPGAEAERLAAALAWRLLGAAAAGAVEGTAAGERTPLDPLVARARALLHQGLADPAIDITVIARRLGVDRAVLSRRFTAALGMAPKPWQSALRLGRARTLLATTDQSVVRIARACGFTDASYFARTFRAETGLGPARWRRLHGQSG